jgi:hypothetical protein
VFENLFARRRVEAELQSHVRHGREVRVAGTPHLSEASHSEQLHQHSINPGEWAVAWLEARQALRQEHQQILRLAKGTGRRDRPPARVGGPAQRLADGAWHLGEVGRQRLTNRRRLAGSLHGNDLFGSLLYLRRGGLIHLFQFGT